MTTKLKHSIYLILGGIYFTTVLIGSAHSEVVEGPLVSESRVSYALRDLPHMANCGVNTLVATALFLNPEVGTTKLTASIKAGERFERMLSFEDMAAFFQALDIPCVPVRTSAPADIVQELIAGRAIIAHQLSPETGVHYVMMALNKKGQVIIIDHPKPRATLNKYELKSILEQRCTGNFLICGELGKLAELKERSESSPQLGDPSISLKANSERGPDWAAGNNSIVRGSLIEFSPELHVTTPAFVGQSVKTWLEAKNIGATPLLLKSVKGACSCFHGSDIGKEGRVIEPGITGKIELSFGGPSLRFDYRTDIALETNDSERPICVVNVLFTKASQGKSIAILGQHQSLGIQHASNPRPIVYTFVDLSSHSDLENLIKNIEYDHNRFELKIIPSQSDSLGHIAFASLALCVSFKQPPPEKLQVSFKVHTVDIGDFELSAVGSFIP